MMDAGKAGYEGDVEDGREPHLDPLTQSWAFFIFFPGLLLCTISTGRSLVLFSSRA
jgi:hypothetical protein